MEAKIFEVRDAGTFIPVIGLRLNPANEAERYLLSRAGWGPEAKEQGETFLLGKSQEENPQFFANPALISGTLVRTWIEAHKHMRMHWNTLRPGEVICIETLNREREKKKVSEWYEGAPETGTDDARFLPY